MSALVHLHFQGEPAITGTLSPEDVDTVRREAFPRFPRRDAFLDAGWRSYKLAPLPSGQLLVSVAMNQGETDRFGRPVLSARALVLALRELRGALRDPVAAWRALEAVQDPTDVQALAEAVHDASALTHPERFRRLVADHRQRGAFYARAAATLGSPPLELFLPAGRAAATALRPILLLLPAARLCRLHLATGSERGERAEAVLGLEGSPEAPPPPPRASGGLLGGLLRREPEGPAPPMQVDLVQHRLRGQPPAGPQWLSELVASDSEWPGVDPMARLELVLSCMDGGGGPFERIPELERMRRVVREVEAVAQGLRQWP